MWFFERNSDFLFTIAPLATFYFIAVSRVVVNPTQCVTHELRLCAWRQAICAMFITALQNEQSWNADTPYLQCSYHTISNSIGNDTCTFPTDSYTVHTTTKDMILLLYFVVQLFCGKRHKVFKWSIFNAWSALKCCSTNRPWAIWLQFSQAYMHEIRINSTSGWTFCAGGCQ